MNASIPKMEKENKEKYDYEFSDREMETLKLTIDGYSYRQIAEKLFLSGNTVKKHLANIYHKLHVTSKAQAIKIATKSKLIWANSLFYLNKDFIRWSGAASVTINKEERRLLVFLCAFASLRETIIFLFHLRAHGVFNASKQMLKI